MQAYILYSLRACPSTKTGEIVQSKIKYDICVCDMWLLLITALLLTYSILVLCYTKVYANISTETVLYPLRGVFVQLRAIGVAECDGAIGHSGVGPS